MTSIDKPAEPALQHASPDSEEALIDSLWSSLVRPALKKESANPYIEEETRYLTGRDGIGSDEALRLLSVCFFEYADQWRDNAEHYISSESHRACKEAIEAELDSSSGQALIEGYCQRAQGSDDEGPDEDELRDQLLDGLEERAMEEGLGDLYDMSVSLSGSIAASASLVFNISRESVSDASVLLPSLGEEWPQFLIWLNIPPPAFANFCRDKAKEELARLKALPKEEREASDQARLIKEWLQEQGLGRACSAAPEKWPSGLRDGAARLALTGASYPQGTPSCSMEELYEALLKSEDQYVEIEMELGMDASDITLASELIDRFSEAGPLIGWRSLERSMLASPSSIYLNGETLALSRPISIARDSVSFSDNSGDSSLVAAESAKRQLALEASSLCWGPSHLLNDATSDEDFAEGLSDIAKKARVFGSKATPEALSHAKAKALSFTTSAEAPSAQSLERLELYRSAFIDQMEAGARSGAERKKTSASAAPTSKPADADLALHELIEINAFGEAQKSQWRHSAELLISKKAKEGRLDEADAFGNTLLRKAMLCADFPLCETLLRAGANPLAENVNGDTMWSGLAGLVQGDALGAIKSLSSFGMASWRDKGGGNLIHHCSAFDIAFALAKAGVDPTLINKAGKRADYGIYSEQKKALLEAAFLESALAPVKAPAKKSMAL